MTSHADQAAQAAHAAHAAHAHSTALAEMLDLDAEVSEDYLSALFDWFGPQVPEHPRRVLDLGAGTGTGTVTLAERFPRAEVYAVDISAEMLSRVHHRAVTAGVGDRIQTVQADLDSSWPELGTIDVIWASASLHEFSHPEDVLRNALLALAPGGVIGIIEMDTPPLFLPDDLGFGAPGLEARIHNALSDQQSGWHHPDWSDGLAAAGFTGLEKRTFTIDVPPERLKPVGRYADVYLRRLHPRLEGKLSAEDLTALDTLLSGDDPRSLSRRNDLHVRGIRTAWTGRRPEPA